MKIKGVCRRTNIRDDDCILVRHMGDLVVLRRVEAHEADAKFWDDVLAPLLSEKLKALSKDFLLDASPDKHPEKN